MESEETLRWVEIINVRLAANAEKLELQGLFRDIRKSVIEGVEEDVRMVIFKSRFVEGDWAIHLHRQTKDSPSGKTGLGIKLADIIRQMALVDHSIWVEDECCDQFYS